MNSRNNALISILFCVCLLIPGCIQDQITANNEISVGEPAEDNGGTSVEVVGFTGMLFDGANRPLGNQSIQVLKYNTTPTGPSVSKDSTMTNPDGSFAIPIIETGEYLLQSSTGTEAVNVHSMVNTLEESVQLDSVKMDKPGTIVVGDFKVNGFEASDTLMVLSYIRIEKGNFIIRNTKTIRFFPDSNLTDIPYGEYRVSYNLSYNHIIPGYIPPGETPFTGKGGTYILFDTMVTVFPGQVTTIPPRTIDVSDPKVSKRDSLALSAILLKTGNDPQVTRDWFHPISGRVEKCEIDAKIPVRYSDIDEHLAVLTELKILMLKYFRGDSVPKSIASLKRLTELSLTEGELSFIPEEIGELPELLKLSLKWQQFKEFPTFIFKQESKLQSFNLDENPLSPLGWETQSKINDLSRKTDEKGSMSLSISFGGHSNSYIDKENYTIMREFLNINGLEDRYMHQYINSLSSEGLAALNGLELGCIVEINIPDQVIHTIPSSFSNLKGLIGLRIGKNRLNSLPGFLWELPLLKTIRVRNGSLRSISPELSMLSGLEIFDVSNNQLTSVPSWLSDLPALKYADFSANRVHSNDSIGFQSANCLLSDQKNETSTSIDDGLMKKDLEIVKTIRGVSNMDKIPDDFRIINNRVVSLRVYFSVFMNHLPSLDLAVQLDSLKLLEIVAFNERIIPELSVVLPQVKTLIINGFGADSLPTGLLSSFPNLKHIGLRNHSFTSIPPALKSLEKLEIVDLYGNKLHGLSEDDQAWLELHCQNLPEAIVNKDNLYPYNPNETCLSSQKP